MGKTKDKETVEHEMPTVLPVLPVRDVVIFNYMILPLFIGRDKSVQAVESTLKSSRHLFVCAQREEGIEDPTPEDMYSTGTIVQVMRMLKMPDSRVKILVQGVSRARIKEYSQTEPYLEAHIEVVPEVTPATDAAVEALLRAAREQSEKVFSLRGMTSPDMLAVLQGVDEPGRLADLIAANMRLKLADAQQILEADDALERLSLVNSQLQHEVEVATVQARIQSSAREGMDKAQKDYFLREQMKAIRHELGDKDEDAEEDLDLLKKALDKVGLPKDVRKEANKQLRRLSSMHADSSEANVVRTYLDWLVELPWKKLSRDRLDIAYAKQVLDEDHCGLDKVKGRILEFLSVRKLNPGSKGPILCFTGPPGVGKTSLGRSIARALGRKFQRLSLGGMHDEAEIRGHRRTYIGSMPGRIIQALKQAGTRNPVIVLDEVDKLGTDFRGDPSSALLEVLDPEQNHTFSDHYLNVPFDLSRVMFLCTANHLDTIPAPLRDRMEVIPLTGYTMQEKVEIAHKHLLPKKILENGLKARDVVVSDAAVERMIREYTREAGLRNIERELAAVCRKLARRRAEGKKGVFSIDVNEIAKLLGVPRFMEDEKEKRLMPGMALGLAWTPAGGDVLTVETSVMKGKGGLTLTGQLGDVMKESAQAALSYIRSHAESLGIDPAFAVKRDIHVHVPAGATPKDGPSAGVTLTTAIISALNGRRVRADICMTGEITLQGRVLPVGGIKEKILAGVARGLKHVILPQQNIKDLEDVPKDLLKRIKVHSVHHFDDLLPLIFEDRGKQAH
ncbi:MAG: ATP-dependent protease La [Candidatus Desulfovibrio kirbyi]|jgi:ATP-dependent Lon protease|uniref:Lon protease n=1 Tax=Candidatus Desulfovibrio kirbyi TaxID=2696086 RepID=A0A6L2R5L0_9BACT|nr:endopeptidase La [Desulfovibrio sp.]GFH62858.1 MAG: ATP-dependent protease La [Candidatus Desulfovibrio kirbyi]